MRSLRLGLLFCAGVWVTILASNRVPVTRDLGATHLPWREEWARQVKNGWLPLWNPKANGGRPLWADPNSQAAYPGTLLFLLLPPGHGMGVFLACHHLVLLAGLAYLARKSGVGSEAALGAALIVGTSGLTFSLTTFPNALASSSWLPWALGVLLGGNTPSGLSSLAVLGSGGLLGLSFLGGEPVTAGLGLGLGAILVITRKRSLKTLVLLAVGFFTVALPVLLPLLTVLPETVRGSLGTSSQALAADCLAPRRFVELFFPRILGTPLGDAHSGFWAAASFPWQRYYPLVFLGGGATALLALGARYHPQRRWWFGVLLAGVTAAALPAWAPVRQLLAHVPGTHLIRFAIKALQLSLLAAAPLVAAGLEGCQKRPKRFRWGLGAAAAIFLLPALFPDGSRKLLAFLYPASAPPLQKVPASSLASWLVLDGLTNAVPLLALAASGATGLLVWVFLLIQWPLFFVTHVIAPQKLWTQTPETARQLTTEKAIASFVEDVGAVPSPLDSFLAFRDALVPDYGMPYGFSYALARGPDGLEPIRGELLAAFAEKLHPEQAVRLARSLGAQAVLFPKKGAPPHCVPVGEVGVCRVAQPAPPAYLVKRAFPADTLEQAAAWLSAESFIPGADVVLEGSLPFQASSTGEVREDPGSPHARRFHVRTPERTWLVVQQNYLSLWQATVDGVATRVVPANFARTAVPVPAGNHLVELRLATWPYAVGALGPLLFLLTGLYLRTWVREAPSGDRGRNTPARAPER